MFHLRVIKGASATLPFPFLQGSFWVCQWLRFDSAGSNNTRGPCYPGEVREQQHCIIRELLEMQNLRSHARLSKI